MNDVKCVQHYRDCFHNSVVTSISSETRQRQWIRRRSEERLKGRIKRIKNLKVVKQREGISGGNEGETINLFGRRGDTETGNFDSKRHLPRTFNMISIIQAYRL